MRRSAFLTSALALLAACATQTFDGKPTDWDHVTETRTSDRSFIVRVVLGGYNHTPTRLHIVAVTRARQLAKENGFTGFMIGAPQVAYTMGSGVGAAVPVLLTSERNERDDRLLYFAADDTPRSAVPVSGPQVEGLTKLGHGKATSVGSGTLSVHATYFDGAAQERPEPGLYYVHPGDQMIGAIFTYRAWALATPRQGSVAFRANLEPRRTYRVAGNQLEDRFDFWIEDDAGNIIARTRVPK